jgi:hypothetical protein
VVIATSVFGWLFWIALAWIALYAAVWLIVFPFALAGWLRDRRQATTMAPARSLVAFLLESFSL